MDTSLDASIAAALAENEPLTAPEIASDLGVHAVTVQRHCQQLQRKGRIRQTTGGGYILAKTEWHGSQRTASD